MPQRLRSPAAFSAPRPQPPATWKTTLEPRAIWFSASSLHFAWCPSPVSSRARLDPGVGLRGAGEVAGDEPIDRRLLHAADGADHIVAGTALLLEPGEITDEVADLLLPEEQPLDVRRLARDECVVDVDDREADLRVLLRHLPDRVALRETDPDHEVVPVPRQPAHVRDVVGSRGRFDHASLDPELLLGPRESAERELVEAVVVELALVGDQADADRLFRPCGCGGRRRLAGFVIRAAAAGEDDERKEQCERKQTTHEESLSVRF